MKPPKAQVGFKFANILWPGRLFTEMKSRGVKLEKRYDQLFDYWSYIARKHRSPAIPRIRQCR